MTFSYSFSFDDEISKKPLMPLWAYGGVETIPAFDGSVLVRRTDDDRRALLRVEVAAALDACRRFNTLGHHAKAIGEIIPELQGKPDDVLPVLQQMVDKGFIQGADTLYEQLQQPLTPVADAPPEVFVITCDRPEAVTRLLTALVEQTASHAFRITVIDDSRDTQNQALNAAHCREATSRLSLRYFGIESRKAMISALQRAVPEATDSAAFFLDRDQWPGQPTYGLARNFALLLSAGKRALILDDDTLPVAIAAPNAEERIRFGTANDRRMAFGLDVVGLMETPDRLSASPLSLSADVLGASLAELIKQYPGDFHSLHSARVDHWLDLDGSAPVLMTQCGTYGDPGTGDKAHWLINLPTEDIERLLAAGPSIGATLGSQGVWMGYRQPTVMRFGAMSALTGLDNRELLPPYLPVLRGEDLLFGIMLEKLEPRGVVLGQHWAIPHLPVDERGAPGLDGNLASRASVHALAHWIDRCDVGAPADRDQRLRQIAAHIARLAAAPLDEQRSQLKSELTRQHLSQLEQVSRCARETGHIAHDEWQSYLTQAREELSHVLQHPLSDQQLFGERDADATQQKLRHEGRRLADALGHWPALWRAVQDLDD